MLSNVADSRSRPSSPRLRMPDQQTELSAFIGDRAGDLTGRRVAQQRQGLVEIGFADTIFADKHRQGMDGYGEPPNGAIIRDRNVGRTHHMLSIGGWLCICGRTADKIV